MFITRNDLKNILKNYHSNIKTTLNSKVDKITGKGLSTNDYTTTEKNKLAGIETEANKYTHPTTHPASMISGLHNIATSGSYNDLLNKPSTFPPSSHTHSEYLPTAGGTVTGNIGFEGEMYTKIGESPVHIQTILSDVLDGKTNADTVDNKHASEFVQMPSGRISVDDLNNANYTYAYRSSISDGTQIGLPVASWYHIDYFRHLDNNGYGYQVAYPLNHNGAIYARWSSGTTWQSWVQLYDSGHKPTASDVGALPLSGGTITGNIGYSGGGYNGKFITFLNQDANGAGVAIGCGGLTIVGAGEAGTGYLTGQPDGFNGGTEQLVLASDNTIIFRTGAQSGISASKKSTLDSNGGFTIAASTGNLKRTTISTSSPSGGANGDIWILYS